MTILVIDDSKEFREFLSMVLVDRLGLEVIEATNGVDGLEKLAEFFDKITMIILDVKMPKMSGSVFLQKLKDFKLDDKPIAIVSSNPQDSGWYCHESVKHVFCKNDLLDLNKRTTDSIREIIANTLGQGSRDIESILRSQLDHKH